MISGGVGGGGGVEVNEFALIHLLLLSEAKFGEDTLIAGGFLDCFGFLLVLEAHIQMCSCTWKLNYSPKFIK